MMKSMRCGVLGCPSRFQQRRGPAAIKRPNTKQLRFYKIPSDIERQKQWIDAIKFNSAQTKCKVYNIMICEEHFDYNDYVVLKNGITRLKSSVVPHKNLPISTPYHSSDDAAAFLSNLNRLESNFSGYNNGFIVDNPTEECTKIVSPTPRPKECNMSDSIYVVEYNKPVKSIKLFNTLNSSPVDNEASTHVTNNQHKIPETRLQIKCSVFGCISNYTKSMERTIQSNKKRIRFFRMPKHSGRRMQWLNAPIIYETNAMGTNHDNIIVCELHFGEHDFHQGMNSKRRLNLSAVPKFNFIDNNNLKKSLAHANEFGDYGLQKDYENILNEFLIIQRNEMTTTGDDDQIIDPEEHALSQLCRQLKRKNKNYRNLIRTERQKCASLNSALSRIFTPSQLNQLKYPHQNIQPEDLQDKEIIYNQQNSRLLKSLLQKGFPFVPLVHQVGGRKQDADSSGPDDANDMIE